MTILCVHIYANYFKLFIFFFLGDSKLSFKRARGDAARNTMRAAKVRDKSLKKNQCTLVDSV